MIESSRTCQQCVISYGKAHPERCARATNIALKHPGLGPEALHNVLANAGLPTTEAQVQQSILAHCRAPRTEES